MYPESDPSALEPPAPEAALIPVPTPPKPPLLVRFIIAFTGPWTLHNLISWIVLITALLFIKGCVIDQYTIPSDSMLPTLHGDTFFKGDRVLVNKWEMGPRIPFTTIRLWDWGAPKRWDIVVFHPVKGSSEHHTLIKRVVGLPGEHVRIRQGRIEVNGQPVPFPSEMPPDSYYVNDEDILTQIGLAQNAEVRDTLMQLRERYPYRYACVDQEEYTVIPDGHYLMLGDNSFNSVDGRVWGWVPRNHILGRAFAVWWPITRRKDFSGFSHTWWGKMLLYGIPAGLVLLELRNQYRDRRRRREA